MGGQGETRARVLVVDDDLPAGQALSRMLGASGFKVDCVSDASTGLSLMRSRPYAVVLTDAALCEAHGPDMVRRMRELGLQQPVVVMTDGPSTTERLPDTREVQKPVAFRALELLLRELSTVPIDQNGPASVSPGSGVGPTPALRR